jgi:hypothetical protein
MIFSLKIAFPLPLPLPPREGDYCLEEEKDEWVCLFVLIFILLFKFMHIIAN